MSKSILIKNGTLVNPATGYQGVQDVFIEGDRIARIGDSIETDADKVIDAEGLYVMPGFVDLHVHLRDPGLTHKEDIETGGKAAAHGGVTTVCAMPNTKPVVDSLDTLSYVQEKAAKSSPVNIRQISAITMGQNNQELVDMESMKEAGAIAFSEDGKSVMDIKLYREAMKKAAAMGAVIMAHCEDKDLVGKGVLNEGIASARFNVPGISNAVEDVIAARDIFLAGETGAKLHLCHCSTEASVLLVRMAKKLGYNVTAEVCPHHFTLTDSDITEIDTNYKMNPPLRTKKDVDALIAGLADGTMDCIATDHAPHSREEKAGDFVAAPFGITGLETSASLTYTALVDTGYMTIMDMAAKMSYNPAKVIGIDDERGSLEENMIADVVIFDPDAEYTVSADDMESKSTNTPYIGRRLKGRVTATICSGRLVYQMK
jgi:dihydroorotase